MIRPSLVPITLKRHLGFVTLFTVSYILIFSFVYGQTALLETNRIKILLEQQALVLSEASEDKVDWSINTRIPKDLRPIAFSALFDRDHRFLRGNIRHLPESVPLDGTAHILDAAEIGEDVESFEPFIFVARTLPDQRIILIGRTIQNLANLKESVIRALQIGVFPMAALAVVASFILSIRMNRRLKRAYDVLLRVQEGQLHCRLPISSSRDELDAFSEQVNAMVSELEKVVHELSHVGNSIAHDLRTPLARVRAHLEKASLRMEESDPNLDLVTRALAGLDQTFAITTALLRIAKIEAGKAYASFDWLSLPDLAHEVADLYGPIAETRRIAFEVRLEATPKIRGDRDLLLEALANLVDNAIKFTPENGRVTIVVSEGEQGPLVTVSDTGIGVSEKDRLNIFKRFYRCSRSRHILGNGLGLALVAAIVRLHNFTITVKDGSPGSVFELHCSQQVKPSWIP
jgi:signal transduction histidine kinase